MSQNVNQKDVNKDNINKSVDQAEIDKFSAMAEEWWDPKGKFKPLHKFNPVRLSYIREKVIANFNLDENEIRPFKNLEIIDIGCGGGLLSVPMTRLGAQVTGIDAAEKNIKIAQTHAENEGLEIDYRQTSAEELAEQGKQFDVILNMEVIEHVADVESFMKSSCDLLKPGGIMFVATLNRTPKSFLFAIVGAEYVLNWLPKGTHQWQKFLKPHEINNLFEQNGLPLEDSSGVKYNPLSDSFYLSKDMGVNFMMIGKKPE